MDSGQGWLTVLSRSSGVSKQRMPETCHTPVEKLSGNQAAVALICCVNCEAEEE